MTVILNEVKNLFRFIASFQFFFLLWFFSSVPSWAADYHWASPIRFATASCTEFSWVSDLPFTTETTSFLQQGAIELGLSREKIDSWQNGSGEEFLDWLHALSKKGEAETTLVFYFSTHQKRDGQIKFSKGSDLTSKTFVSSFNDLSKNYHRVLLINDSCYSSVLEKVEPFSEKVIRLYSTREDEVAKDFPFDQGPYGFDEFTQKERLFLKKMDWPIKGMSFIGIIGLKAGLQLTREAASSIDLQTLLSEMNLCRDQYNAEIRQARAQHFQLVPSDANFRMIERVRN